MLDTNEKITFTPHTSGQGQTQSYTEHSLDTNSKSFMLMPIAVVGVGRSGTTLLMAHLARDERILFDRTYAFETRLLSYIAKFSQTLPVVPLYKPEMTIRAMSPSLTERQPICLGTGTRSTDLRFSDTQLLRTVWNSISISSLENNRNALWYAEKTSLWVPLFLQDKLPVITIFIFRDPKDIFLSQIAFSEKIDTNAFQANDGALKLVYELSCIFEEFLAQEQAENSIVIKYEDLVKEPEKVLTLLQDSIGWKPSDALKQDFYDKHRTTKDPGSSIERWKSEEISSKELFYLDSVPTEMMEYFNYSPSNPAITNRLWKIDLTEDQNPHFRVDNADLSIESGRSLRIVSTAAATSIVVNRGERTLGKTAEVWLCIGQSCHNTFALYWRHSDQSFSDDRVIVAQREDLKHTNILRFKVGEHPGWSEQFAELFISGWHQAGVEEQQPSFVRWIKFIPESEGVNHQ
ncbi:MAG: hypothetical protein C0469_00995 [Cyanobacteria bacterium DS2.3.42]|nr:hypothetical protein [Cyanobacteria bacterium DS2.3.42]